MGVIHDVKPRETDGRETILRFRMQFQAAAYAALEILTGIDVDRVYCDYHDDFVVRRASMGKHKYHFFQVKTKEKLHKQFDLLEVFSIKKTGNLDEPERHKAIRNSIAGKLFIHTIEFGENCHEVTILSNVHFNEDVLNTIDDIRSGVGTKKYTKYFIEDFSKIFELDDSFNKEKINILLKKLTLMPSVSHIGDSLDQFTSMARTAIWNHSEIDLRPHEIDEIAKSLVSMVMNKSCDRLTNVKKENIDCLAGVGLEDLLDVLSISTNVYKNLLAGDDPKAIKTASIIQRQLREVGANENMIELASRLKVKWDVWHRNARHIHTEFDLQNLLDKVDDVCNRWQRSGGKIADLRELIQDLAAESFMKIFSTLDLELLFGGVCAAIVRRATR